MRLKIISPYAQYMIIGIIGASLGLLMMVILRTQSRMSAIDRLDRRAEQLAVAVQQSISAKLQVLQAFQAFYTVDQEIDAGEFKKFAVVTLTYHSDIQALQWIPYTPVSEREALEARGQAEHSPDFRITERDDAGNFVPADDREFYFPIYYTEPLEGNQQVLGLDAAFEPTRRAVLIEAWERGTATASSPIRLVQEPGDQRAVLLYQPIYSETPPPSTVEERVESLLGMVPVVLRAGEFMIASLHNFDTSGFAITLTDPAVPDMPLYRSHDEITVDWDSLVMTKDITLANRHWELEFVTSGAVVDAEAQFSGIVGLLGAVVVTVLLIVYLEQRTRSEQALRGYAATLEATNSELDAYNHTIAHDLKSPLAIISGYAYLLMDEELSPEGQRMLGEIPKVVDNMVEMIDGLLQLAQLRDAEASVTVVDMRAALNKALARFGDQRQSIEVEDELPDAMGHAPWLVEVFANLINNALKYTPGDRVPEIRIKGFRQDGVARYEVSDNGVGIKPEDQTRVFEMFTRLYTSRQKGLGIGLSIVKRIIDRLNGEVGVVSAPGEGSTFWFTLPAANSADEN